MSKSIIKKTDWYWSDRWQKVINCYECVDCGKHLSSLDESHKTHKCNPNPKRVNNPNEQD
jgi:Zn ribbon nucleic-acid-binding protein